MVLLGRAAGRPAARLSRFYQTPIKPRLTPKLRMRLYASEAHGKKEGSDIPWAIGAVVFTVASCGYLLANDPTGKDKSGHGHGDESHEEHEEKKEESKEEKDGEEEVEDGDEGAKSEISGEGKESEPSSKSGGEKKESESSSGSDGKDSIPEGDKANTGTREAGGLNTQSGKQEGLSNADTKHSTQPHEDPGKSKKGEGVTETAKLKGTVSRDRPLR